ncbi:MAG: UbiA family prenyltransferase [Bdellovibrionaceae bacterium]|nr:UbiA family prenyltransferase [Pseudobdellovibrionaceae bacterium]
MNSEKLITLHRNHPDFSPHLLGTFSETHRAIPVETLNINSQSETVTFRIVPVTEIEEPGALKLWSTALRIRSFLVILFPFFAVLSRLFADGHRPDPLLLLLTFVGLFLLHGGIHLRNDYEDHLLGLDRLDPESGSQVVQRGWMTAEQCRRLSVRFVFVAVLFAVPLLIVQPRLFFHLIVAAAIGVPAFFRLGRGFRSAWWGEFVLLFLVGPLLTSGLELAWTGRITVEGFFFGVLWGWIALFPVHLRHLQQMVVRHRAGILSLVGKLGFDRGRVMIRRWWFVGVTGWLLYHVFSGPSFFLWYFGLFIVIVSARFSAQLGELQSPVGSGIKSVVRSGRYTWLALVSCWTLEFIWLIWERL